MSNDASGTAAFIGLVRAERAEAEKNTVETKIEEKPVIETPEATPEAPAAEQPNDAKE